LVVVGVTNSRLGLYGLNFFTAAVQTGFGPFIAVWLTQLGWSFTDIGLALSIGTVAGLVCQLPGGMLVDHVHVKQYAAGGALIVMGLSALLLSLHPSWIVVVSEEIGHSLASCVMTPAIAALTLSLCGHDSFSERLGLNALFASLGSAASAAVLGVVVSYSSERSVFLLTATLVVPALVALLLIHPSECLSAEGEHPALQHPSRREHPDWHIFTEPALHVFAVAVLLFQLANAALLPLALERLTLRGGATGYLVSATIVVPQLLVAVLSPWAGRLAHRIGRRPVLLAGFAAVPVRALLFATLPSALPLTVFQALDGFGGTVLGLMIPLIAADLTQRTGYLNLAIGAMGLASGLGATFSTTMAGWIADTIGPRVAFLSLALVGAAAAALLWAAMPETRPMRVPKVEAIQAA
jgi:MFS family permease